MRSARRSTWPRPARPAMNWSPGAGMRATGGCAGRIRRAIRPLLRWLCGPRGLLPPPARPRRPAAPVKPAGLPPPGRRRGLLAHREHGFGQQIDLWEIGNRRVVDELVDAGILKALG